MELNTGRGWWEDEEELSSAFLVPGSHGSGLIHQGGGGGSMWEW